MTYEILLIVVIGGIGSHQRCSVLASLPLYRLLASGGCASSTQDGVILGSFKLPLLRSGFRLVVFSISHHGDRAVLSASGIMGDKELSTERIADFFAAHKKKKEATK